MEMVKDIIYEFFVSANVSKYSGGALALARMIYRKTDIIVPAKFIVETIKCNPKINEYSLRITENGGIIICI